MLINIVIDFSPYILTKNKTDTVGSYFCGELFSCNIPFCKQDEICVICRERQSITERGVNK